MGIRPFHYASLLFTPRPCGGGKLCKGTWVMCASMCVLTATDILCSTARARAFSTSLKTWALSYLSCSLLASHRALDFLALGHPVNGGLYPYYQQNEHLALSHRSGRHGGRGVGGRGWASCHSLQPTPAPRQFRSPMCWVQSAQSPNFSGFQHCDKQKSRGFTEKKYWDSWIILKH